MGKYDAIAATASRLIAAKGRAVTITRQTVTLVDPVAQTKDTATTFLPMVAVGLPPGKTAEFKIGSLVDRNVLEFHLAPGNKPTPKPGDTLVWDGVRWTLFWVSVLNPAADGALYVLAYGET